MVKKKTTTKPSSKNEIMAVLKNSLKHLAADGGCIEIVKVGREKGVVEI